MPIEGFVDRATTTEIAGWVYDSARKDDPLFLELLRDDVLLGTTLANLYRKDLEDAGKGNGKHGFSFSAPEGGFSPLQVRVKGQRFFLPEPSRIHIPRLQAEFRHSLEFGLPKLPFGFTPEPQVPDEAALVERFVGAFDRARAEDARLRNRRDMWSDINDEFHANLLTQIRKHKFKDIADHLRSAHANPITDGISQGHRATLGLRNDRNMAETTAAKYFDRLVSLAESIGLLTEECSEQSGQFATNLHTEPEALLANLQAAVGFPLNPPNPPGGLFGLKFANGAILSERDLYALSTALRLKQLATALPNTPAPAVVEIGGGAAGVAYFAHRLGLTDYTIIDLPLVSLLQAYCLCLHLGPQAISLYGETHTPGQIRLLPTFAFHQEAATYDILLNQDSFPEIHHTYATQYLLSAQQKVRHFFLSINQEAHGRQTQGASQLIVSRLVAPLPGYRLISRSRHWLRPGYVEELFQIVH